MQLGVVVNLKEKVARLSLSSPSVVRVCVVGMGMGMRYDISVTFWLVLHIRITKYAEFA